MMLYPDFANNKTSALISSQIPANIKENYQTFVNFLELYYEFLEQNGQLTNTAKNIPNYLDVDYVMENNLQAFVDVFTETYIKPIPSNILTDKAKLIKHIRNFYNSRGTEKSYKFLFRILFNEDVEIFNYGSQILKLSDGKWYQPTVLRIQSANAVGSWAGSQIFGQNSYASAVVETGNQIIENGISYDELSISNLQKQFLPNETITAVSISGQNLYAQVLGIVSTIIVTTPGSSYNVGDPVLITGGGGSGANAYVSAVTSGQIVAFNIVNGAAGFQEYPNFQIEINGSTAPTNAVITLIDTSGTIAPNSYLILDDSVQPSLDILLNTAFTNFSTTGITLDSRIIDASKYVTYNNCGPLKLITVIEGGSGYTQTPTITITQNTFIGTSQTSISQYGSIGTFSVVNGGQNYALNDDVKLNNLYSRGVNSGGRVNQIGANGNILNVIVDYPSIDGTGNIATGSNTVIGTNTFFTTELLANDNPTTSGSGTTIVIDGQASEVMNIANNTYLTVANNFTTTAANQVIRLSGYMLGGYGYTQNDIPNGVTCTVLSQTGSNATIQIDTLLGQDYVVTPTGGAYGQVEIITVNQFGSNYSSAPTIDLTKSGDGTAVAKAAVLSGTFQYPGYWLNEDGRLSSNRYLQDPDKYNFYSYLIESNVAVTAYYNLVYQLLNPVGAKIIGVTKINSTTPSQNTTLTFTDKNSLDVGVINPLYNFNFINGNTTINPNINFSNGGLSTYFNSAGILSYAPRNTPRLSYNPHTLQPLGLMVEDATYNQLLYSANLTNQTVWSLRNSATITSGYISPDGTANAALLSVPTTSSNIYDISQIIPGPWGNGIAGETFSIFAKANGTNYIHLLMWDLGTDNEGGVELWANLSSGTITATSTTGNCSFRDAGAGTFIQPINNGWYRIGFVANMTTTPNSVISCLARLSNQSGDNGGSVTPGNGTLLFGAQSRNYSYETSYIPTNATGEWGNGDVANVALGVYSNQSGTIIIQSTIINYVPPEGGHWIININDNTYANCMGIYNQVGENINFMIYKENNTNYINGGGGGTIILGTPQTNLISWQNNGANSNVFYSSTTSYNPLTFTMNEVDNLPTINTMTLDLGNQLNNGLLGGAIQSLQFWPNAFDITRLQSLVYEPEKNLPLLGTNFIIDYPY